MEELGCENERLKSNLSKSENELHVAAVFGKQLLETNDKITKKIESLSQEYSLKFETLTQNNHSLQLQLDAKKEVIKNQEDEIETLKEELAKMHLDLEQSLKAEKVSHKKNMELTKENEMLEREVEEAIEEKKNWQKKTLLLEEQVKNAQQCLEKSIVNEDTIGELQILKLEINQLLKSKQDLEQSLCDSNIALENARAKEQRMASFNKKLQEEIESKDYEIASYSSAVEKSKSVTAELQAEIEMMKLQQTDINLRGNSVFSEVEDRRIAAEKELLILKMHYEVALQKNKISMQNQQALRQQLVLQQASNQKVDATYTQNLQEALSQARAEIQNLNRCIAELQKIADNNTVSKPSNIHIDQPVIHSGLVGNYNYDYLKIMLKESQDEVKRIKKEIQSANFMKAAESDKLIQCQKKLFQVEKNYQAAKGEVLKLRIRLEESTKNKEYIKPLKSVSNWWHQDENAASAEDIKNTLPLADLQEKNSNTVSHISPPCDNATKEDKTQINVLEMATSHNENGETEKTKVDLSVSKERRGVKVRGQHMVPPVIKVTHDEDVASCTQQ